MRWTKRKQNGRWPVGVPKPAIPAKGAAPPSGPNWLHEIKHDGYRLIVRREGPNVQIFTRGGYDWTERYPVMVASILKLKAQSFIIDGEGVVEGAPGIADFALLHSRQHDRRCYLIGFDLLEIDGHDLCSLTLETRKDRLAQLLRGSTSGVVYAEHLDCEGSIIFETACRMGLEGIVSKRRDRPYTSGPCKHWVKVKNPLSPAALRFQD
jgi:bifunctional non-homologous end joining protein LigD